MAGVGANPVGVSRTHLAPGLASSNTVCTYVTGQSLSTDMTVSAWGPEGSLTREKKKRSI